MPPTTPTVPQNLAMPIAVVIAGAFIAVAIYFSGGASGAPRDNTNPQPSAPTVNAEDVNLDGVPYIGRADAPLTIAYWFDYQCPFCKQFEETTVGRIIAEYVDSGKVKLVFKDFAFLGPDSMTVGQWARAVWEQSPEKYYDWHHELFVNQGQEHSGWATTAFLTTLTNRVLGASDGAAVAALVKSKGAEYQAAMDADRAEGASMGVNGTPAMIVGTQFVQGAAGYSQVQNVIEGELAKQ